MENKEAATAETNHEAKFTLSPFWLWVVRWVARCAKYLLIVPILMGIGYALCAGGYGPDTFITTAVSTAVLIAIVTGVLAHIWQKKEKSWFKVEESAEATNSQSTGLDDVKNKKLPAAQTESVPVDSSTTPAYKLGEKDFHNGDEPQGSSKFSDLDYEQYRQGYSAAHINSGLTGPEEAEHE